MKRTTAPMFVDMHAGLDRAVAHLSRRCQDPTKVVKCIYELPAILDSESPEGWWRIGEVRDLAGDQYWKVWIQAKTHRVVTLWHHSDWHEDHMARMKREFG